MRRAIFRACSLSAALLAGGGVVALSGCGQSGPLYLPPPKPQRVQKARPARTAHPAPAPATGTGSQ